MTDTSTKLPDLVGITEIAERLGVAKGTVDSWRFRGEALRGQPMPEPDLHISKTPIWLWARIDEWAKATGRGTR